MSGALSAVIWCASISATIRAGSACAPVGATTTHPPRSSGAKSCQIYGSNVSGVSASIRSAAPTISRRYAVIDPNDCPSRPISSVERTSIC